MNFWTRTARQLLLGYIIVLALTAACCLFTYLTYVADGKKEICSHASAVAYDLWQFDSEGAGHYLKMAAGAGHYKNFDISDINGDLFLHVEGPPLSGMDAFLHRMGLIPLHKFSAEIIYNRNVIGTLTGTQYLRFIYPCFNFLIFLLLIMFTVLFILHLSDSRKMLQEEITAKTQAIKETERRFHDLVTMLPEMIWEADLDGTITYANRVVWDRFGYSLDALEQIRLNVLDFIAPEDRETAKNNYALMLQGKKDGYSEYLCMTADGRKFPVSVRSAPVYKDGKLVGARGLLIDMTEMHKLESQLRQAQKLEAIGTLAGGIAHDFNNILTAIMGYLQLVQMDVADRPKVLSRVEEAYNAANRAKELVQQILTFSRRTEEDNKHPLKLSTITKESLKLLRSSIPSTINIVQEINSDASILADPTRMHQMIMNICTNAYQAMQESGGTLTVRLSEVTLKDDREGNEPGEKIYVRLDISDTGQGIDHEILDRIFDPYFTTKKTGEGTGLGLSMVHGIVEEHNGFIEINSKIGEGTTFSIFLPVVAADRQGVHDKKDKARANLPAGGNESIMVVDDERQIVEITKDFLERLGYRVTVFTDANEAKKAFETAPDEYDIVISDQTMPGMRGTELCKEIKLIRPDCPVILCSGYKASLSSSHDSTGINAFLYKPVILSELARRVRELLDSKPGDEDSKATSEGN